VIELEREPPAYLVRELGTAPEAGTGQAAWRDGARLIERYRAQHNVHDPTTAFGSRPSDQIVEQVQALRVQIRRSAVTLDRPALGERPAIDLETP